MLGAYAIELTNTDFLMAVKQNVHSIKPHWVMTDDAEQYFSEWVAVFGMGPKKLLCTWHVDRAWRGAVNAIQDKQIAALVYHNIRLLMEESDVENFKFMLDRTLQQRNESRTTEEFAKYFNTHYVPRAEQWATCFWKSANISTNMYVESFHRTLKYVYMKERINKRIDNLKHVLIKISRDKLLSKLKKGKISGRLSAIRKRHLASTNLSVGDTKI